jgi:MarR family transcriptional regulator, organic hydroperoxide resistance regulator
MNSTLGTQLRHLIELLDSAIEQSYFNDGVSYKSRYTPVMRALLANEPHQPMTIGDIANAARITQPAVTQTVALMLKAGLISAKAGDNDARQRLIELTEKGHALMPHLNMHWQATAIAAAHLDAELPTPLSAAVAHAITALEAQPFSTRLAAAQAQLVSTKARPKSNSAKTKKPSKPSKSIKTPSVLPTPRKKNKT